jgi:hypothetical protein
MKILVIVLALTLPCSAVAQPFSPFPQQYPLLQQRLNDQQLELQSPAAPQQFDSLQLQMQQQQSQIERLEGTSGSAAQRSSQLPLLQRQLTNQQLELQELQMQQRNCQIGGSC